MAGQRMEVIFHGCRASGRDRRGRAGAAAPVASGEVLWGENLLCGGGHAIHQEPEQDLRVEPREDRVVSVVRKTIEITQGLPSLELQLSGKGLARCREASSVRFQSLPIGTVRAVFPHTARPVSFARRVMGRASSRPSSRRGSR